MSTAVRDPWTVERFLAWEDKQDGRHEFDGARIIAMTGGSRNHQRIIFNLLRALEERLDPQQFEAVAEMRLQVGHRIRYPDMLVHAGQIPGDTRTLRHALVVFEVLSAETAGTDCETKPAEYAQVPGLRRYILIEQGRCHATVLERNGEAWTEREVVAGPIALPQCGIELALEAIHQGVRFPPAV